LFLEERPLSYVKNLICRECGETFEVQPQAVCDFCFGPLEVNYDYDAIAGRLDRQTIHYRPPSMWRYRELLPLDAEATVGLEVGYTPLLPARRLGERLGLRDLWIKNDAVNCPTLSFKDRVVAVALSKALEFGFSVVGCASTGNLANSVAAQAAAAGLTSYILVPHDLEEPKLLGTSCYGAHLVRIAGNYDEVNRLCSEIADERGWAFVNVNLRPFYAEGSKTVGFEIAEQLGWRVPRNVVVPMAGGSLIGKIKKAFDELSRLGLVESAECHFFGAQATGCSPISGAVKEGRADIIPQKPHTIAKSLAIGNPADGYYAAKMILETGGWAEDVSDGEIVEGIELLAETEGVFTETAGGVTVAVTRKLIAEGRINPEETTVLCITGNGLKTPEVLRGRSRGYPVIEPRFSEFEAVTIQ
jgi:threonine synthase